MSSYLIQNIKINTIQYKCYEQIKPISVVEVKFKDFKRYYSITNEMKGKVR